MKFEEKKDLLYQLSPDVIVADGFEDALIGVGQQFNKALAVYDRQKCIEILMERDGMSDEEAVEYFEYNVSGAWVGEYTPIFLETF
jgi:hypothetical protein|tara:strand:- start:1862 stop:2119 length:258 start_codon:yes stop_codon:yes gene_type:complete